MKYLLLFLILTTKIFAQSSEKLGNLNFALEVEKDSFQIFDPVIITFLIENKDSLIQRVNHPHPMKSNMDIFLYKDKEEIALAEWYNPDDLEGVMLPPNGVFRFRFDFAVATHFLDEGNYTLRAKYYPFRTRVTLEDGYKESADINFTIKKLSDDERKIKEMYFAALYDCAGGHQCIILRGEIIIGQFPQSIFSKELKYLMGKEYSNLEKYNKSIEYFEYYLEDKSLHIKKKNTTMWMMAWAYYKKGDKLKALDILQSIDTNEFNEDRVRAYIGEWKRELNK